jgi:hypothetical protein
MESSVSKYTTQELFESLETVDETAYPQRALAIIRQIISLTGLPIEQIIEKYQSGHLFSPMATLLIDPTMGSDYARINQQTIAKLNRLAKFL